MNTYEGYMTDRQFENKVFEAIRKAYGYDHESDMIADWLIDHIEY